MIAASLLLLTLAFPIQVSASAVCEVNIQISDSLLLRHWFVFDLRDPKGRTLFALCGDASIYWRHGAEQGPRKLAKYLDWQRRTGRGGAPVG